MSLDAPGFPTPGTPLLIAPDGTITFIAPPPGPSANLASSAITVNGGAAGATNLFSMWPSGAIGLNGNQSSGNFPGIGVLTPANGGGLRTGFATIGDVPVVVVNGNGVTPPNAIQLAISVGARLRNDGAFAWSSDTAPQSTAADLFLTRAAAATLRLGAAAAAAPVAQTLQSQESRAGTDTNTGGAALTVQSAPGTGTGTLSTYDLASPIAVASGTGAQTMVRGWRIHNGTAVSTGYTVATLPAAPQTGARAHVTDATAPTYLGALTGGGAVTCPVFYNGTAWVSH